MGNTESASSAEMPGSQHHFQTFSTDVESLESNDAWDHGANENRIPNVEITHPKYSTYGGVPSKGLAPPGKQQRSPRPHKGRDAIEGGLDPESRVDGATLNDSEDDADTSISALMEASAAVFLYLANSDAESGNSSFGDDVSIADMSAAVFEHLQHEAATGNEKPMREFLETAQVVSDVLLHEKYDRQPPPSRYQVVHTKQQKNNRRSVEDDSSVSQRRAAIFQALDRTHRESQDRNPSSIRPPSRVQLPEVDEAQSVVSEMSQSIFKVLDETKEKIQEERVSEFSAAVFDLLDNGKATDENDNSTTGTLSELSAAFFKGLEAGGFEARGASGAFTSELNADRSAAGDKTFVSHIMPRTDPKQLMKRNIFHILAQRQNQPYSAIEEEEEPREEEDPREELIQQPRQGEVHNVPLPLKQEVITVEELANPKEKCYIAIMESEQESPREHMTDPTPIFSEEIHADTSDQEIQEEIDLVFVERFDEVFNEFIGLHPRFLLTNPDLVRHLRINKLQKLLEHMDDCETRLLSQISRIIGEKQTMENHLSRQLIEASRSKAVYQIQLQSELSAVKQNTSFKQAQTTWKIVSSSEAKAKKEYLYEQAMKRERDNFFKDNVSGVPTREELVQLLPNDAEGKALKAAISATPRFLSAEREQLDEMRKYQVDNAFMTSEIAVLTKKLSHVEAQSKRMTWVDSLLLRLDKVQMAKLKNKFAHKLGVVSLD